MNVMVTGSSGFIGKNLVKYLVRKDYQNIIGCDVVSASKSYLKTLSGTNFLFNQASFLTPLSEQNLEHQVDTIIHLARTTKPGPQIKNFEKDINENVLGTLNFFKNFANQGLKKFVLISSGGTVYGGQNVNGENSEEDACNPKSFYGIASLMTEKYLEILSKELGIQLIVLRLSNPFGPFQSLNRNQGLVNTIIEKTVNHEALEIWGDGSAIRDYIFVEDVCRAINLSIQYKGDKSVFNIGTGVGRTVKSVVHDVLNLTEKKPPISYGIKQSNAVDKNILNVELAKKELAWEPNTHWELALNKTFEYYKEAVFGVH